MRPTLTKLWPVFALAALTLICLHALAFTDGIIGRGDTFVYFYPYWAARDAALRDLTLPLWTPDLFAGAPLLANPQVGALYPPNGLTVRLAAPDAVRVSALLHVFWAALGAYVLARAEVPARAALVAGAIYGLGGTVGAHLEQINQLQGLAWTPWLFWALRGNRWRVLAAGLAMQFLSGHTQTVFITVVGLGLFALPRPRKLLLLGGAGALALMLALPQLAPTLELIGESGRSGGLTANEAVSFSLRPFIAGRGLLPSYDAKLFTEFIGYVGVGGLMLAVWGAFGGDGKTWRWALIAFAGLFLAFGGFNPVYWLLVELPGPLGVFGFFRVPARWLALFALGAAMLAAHGVNAVRGPSRGQMMVAVGAVGLLAVGSFLAGREAAFIDGPPTPTFRTLAGWGLALGVTLTFAYVGRLRGWLAVVVLAELVAASLILPYNDLVPPEAWTAQRQTISQMRVYAEAASPPGRLLSISGLFFDPGDKATLSARYRAGGATALEERYAFVAAKLKETLSPNLPLAWGVPSLDGFGGGLLPTRHYNTFAELLVPPGVQVPGDGRLREVLALEACRGACIPSAAALGMADVEFIVVDKVFDVWHEGIAYDTTFTHTGEWLAPVPFETTEIRVLHIGEGPPRIDGAEAGDVLSVDDTSQVSVFRSDEPTLLDAVQVEGEVIGVTFVDARTGDFLQATPPGWSRVLSSDIKLYRRTRTLPRAFTVGEARYAEDDTAALGILREGDPTQTAVISGAGDDWLPTPTDVQITAYTPTRMEIAVEPVDGAALLVLSDSYYPGWRATVDGVSVPIERANVNFRAIRLPSGASDVIFQYRLPGWPFAVGGLAWLLTFATILWRWYDRQPGRKERE